MDNGRPLARVHSYRVGPAAPADFDLAALVLTIVALKSTLFPSGGPGEWVRRPLAQIAEGPNESGEAPGARPIFPRPLGLLSYCTKLHIRSNIKLRSCKVINPKELTETALRVLVAWNDGRKPDTVDLQVLRSVWPGADSMAVDELACQVIHTFSRKLVQEPQDAPDPALFDDVA
jgi:hypothetical protein